MLHAPQRPPHPTPRVTTFALRLSSATPGCELSGWDPASSQRVNGRPYWEEGCNKDCGKPPSDRLPLHIAARSFEARWGLTPMSPLDRTGKEASGAATAGVDVARSLTDAPQDGAGVEPAVAVVTAAAAAQRPVPAPAALLVHDPYAGAVDAAVGQRLHHAPARHPAFGLHALGEGP